MWPAEGDSQAKILLYTKAADVKSFLVYQLIYRQTHFILKGSRRALSQNKQRKVLTSSEVCGVVLTALLLLCKAARNTQTLGTNLKAHHSPKNKTKQNKTLIKHRFGISVLIKENGGTQGGISPRGLWVIYMSTSTILSTVNWLKRSF